MNRRLHYESATAFMEAISPLGQIFCDSRPNAPWLHRGLGNDYSLFPSALRQRHDPTQRTSLEQLVGRDLCDCHDRANAELQVLLDFFEIADQRGLVLPGDSQRLRSSLWNIRHSKQGHPEEKDLIDQMYGRKAPEEVLSLIALAQHYGIPTRLLDWTPNVYVACYFAAESAMKRKQDEKMNEIVIWSFFFPLLGRHNNISAELDPFTIVTAPSASNPNLAAQQGLFTLPRSYRFLDGQEYMPFNMILESEGQKINPDGLNAQYEAHQLIGGCQLQKLSLSGKYAEELLYLLAKLNVTHTSVYPGYASIRTELQMRTQWPR